MGSSESLRALRSIVGRRHILTKEGDVRRFSTGFRIGSGRVLAVARPGSLVELWRLLKVCVEADLIVLMQAANTGLTGGSTPNGEYDRPLVLLSTARLRGVHLMQEGEQVVCLPGATLDRLEGLLAGAGREPHSVIGSSCLGASVIGGVCNNSGGALVHRGPAYTEMALFARRSERGELELVNHLGIDLPGDPEAMLTALEGGHFDRSSPSNRRASATDYVSKVRRVDEATPARFNADPSYLHQASGCAGHIAVFAVRLDTFPKASKTTVFYVGSNSTETLTRLRRDILSDFDTVPVSGEYMHRDAFDVAADYGKDMFLAIERLGTSRIPLVNKVKDRIDRVYGAIPLLRRSSSDALLCRIARLLPNHLPPRIVDYRERFEHHLLIRAADGGIDELRRYLAAHFPADGADAFECSEEEGRKAFLHRFVAAGAAVRYRSVHRHDVGGLVSLDIALPRNERHWFEQLPANIASKIRHKIYYGHFFCHVFHQDYIVEHGVDPDEIEHQLLEFQDGRGAEYPAEHNVGHLYHAKEALARHYRELDPTNSFNPGVGQLSRAKNWA